MSNHLTNSHGSQAGPAPKQVQADHVTDGGVPVPADDIFPASRMPDQRPGEHAASSSAVLSATAAVPAPNELTNVDGTLPLHGITHNVNGDSAVKPRYKSVLSGSAAWFKPDAGHAITYLNRGSSADDASGGKVVCRGDATSANAIAKPDKGKGKAKAVQDPIGTPSANFSPTRPPVSFTTDVGPNANAPGGHYLKFEKVTAKRGSGTMMTMNEDFDWNSKITAQHYGGEGPLKPDDKADLYLRFDDVRDSAAAFEQVETVDPSLKLSYVSQSEYAATMRRNSNGPQTVTAFYDGQVIFTCEFKQMAVDFNEQKQALETRIKELADAAGDVLVFDYYSGEGGKIEYRVEYFKISSAKAIVKQITHHNPRTIGGWTVTATEMLPLGIQTTFLGQGVESANNHSGVVTPPNGAKGTSEGSSDPSNGPVVVNGSFATPQHSAMMVNGIFGTPHNSVMIMNGSFPTPQNNAMMINGFATPQSGGMTVNGGFNVPYNGAMMFNGAVTTPQHATQPDVLGKQISPTGRTAWGYDMKNGRRVPLPPPNPVARVAGGLPTADLPHTPGQLRAQSDPMAVVPGPHGAANPQHIFRNASWSGPSHAAGQLVTDSPPSTVSYRKPRKQFTPDGPNKIYPFKIRNGTDVRTSIMLRNLPNGLTYEELKRILDLTSFGRYDFSYLRIDFNNNKNVGYGFVNFCDAVDILPFYDRYFGKPWTPGAKFDRRPRMADLSYATIQGLDGLVDKMRNSSVMDENSDFRPKFWWTSDTALDKTWIGVERTFPGVNNRSKKQRSRDNATQIGLYTAGSRQLRGGIGHQSQFDRGTTAQIQEEAFFNQRMPYQGQLGYGGPNYTLAGGSNTITMVPPPVFPHIPPQNPNGYHNPGMVNGIAVGNRGHYQPYDPFRGYYQGFSTPAWDSSNTPRANVYVPPHARHSVQYTRQYGPMNEVINAPTALPGVVSPSDQASQGMPAIDEETEEYEVLNSDAAQAGPSQQATAYDQDGVQYTLPKEHR